MSRINASNRLCSYPLTAESSRVRSRLMVHHMIERRTGTFMLPFKLVYSDEYYLPIGPHVFPAEKYRRVHRRLIEQGIADPSDFLTPQPASDQDILLVHTPGYVNKLQTGTLSAREELQLEVPYSRELVDAFWLAA